MIKFENVAIRYDSGPDVLQNVNFTLAPGSYHFLSGPSGAGKSSLMSLLYLGRKPSSGKVTMFDRDIGAAPREALFPLRQRIGVVFQDFRLLDHLSAFDNVALPLRIIGRPEAEIRSHVGELLDWVGLGKDKQSLPPTLSGGQQQRIAVARAVIARPRLLLADEPTGNLDDEIGYRLMGLFEQLSRMGTTIVIATHNQQMIEKFGHPRLVLENGSVTVIDETQGKKIRNVF
ncbi:MAG: ATP-binding cassette domain-containing protein [Alphaproteobacteria bacterium]|nr:ATP-binding cassette domain-containing protein [Alphaproteobacteria bacterium]